MNKIENKESSALSSSFDNDDWMKSRGLSCQGRWIEFDDGHVPEIIAQQQDHQKIDRLLAVYPEYMENRVPALRVYDNFVPNHVVEQVYETTRQDNKPWGTYVSMQQVREYWKQQDSVRESITNEKEKEELMKEHVGDTEINSSRDRLALLAVESFLRAALTAKEKVSLSFRKEGDQVVREDQSTKEESGEKADEFWTLNDLDQIHGVAVWSLGAVKGSQVPYHVDYAEQVRYETNRIVPPVLAGTLQCTPHKIVGGDYCAHMTGGLLQHYQRHGYKGVKDPNLNVLDTLDTDPGWVRVPFQFNRLTIQSGHLPHLSTPVESIAGSDTDSNNNKRVILGFNAFLPDIGPLVQRAPEHSQAFRRKVALQRWLLSKTKSAADSTSKQESHKVGGGLNLSTISANPALAKMLVLAKRHKVKAEFRQRQADLDNSIEQALMDCDNNASKCITVQYLMDKLGRTDGQFPSLTDVQVHLHHGQLQGKFVIVDFGEEVTQGKPDSAKPYLSPQFTIRLSTLSAGQ